METIWLQMFFRVPSEALYPAKLHGSSQGAGWEKKINTRKTETSRRSLRGYAVSWSDWRNILYYALEQTMRQLYSFPFFSFR